MRIVNCHQDEIFSTTDRVNVVSPLVFLCNSSYEPGLTSSGKVAKPASDCGGWVLGLGAPGANVGGGGTFDIFPSNAICNVQELASKQ